MQSSIENKKGTGSVLLSPTDEIESERLHLLPRRIVRMPFEGPVVEKNSCFDKEKGKKTCKKMFFNRVPKGKAPFVAFVINVLESFTFFGSLNLIKYSLFGDDKSFDLIFTVLLYTAGRVFYPLAGLLADVYLGRYRVINIGLWLFWIGLVIMTMSLALEWNLKEEFPYKLPSVLAVILFMAGSASVESTIIPFGVDQIRQGASSEELSCYFSWYYFGRNFGYCFYSLSVLAIEAIYIGISNKVDIPDSQSKWDKNFRKCAIGAFVTIFITAAIILHHCVQQWYYKAPQKENPIKSICNILYFAATVKRHPPRYRRSFRYGEGKKSRIELAKIEYDGIYSSEEVEDVKTFFRVLFLVISLGFVFTSDAALLGQFPHEFNTNRSQLVFTYRSISIDSFSLVETSLILFLIIFLNHVILPFMPGANMKIRIGVGVLFFFLSSLLGTVLEVQSSNIHHNTRLLWMIMPIVLYAIGEMLVFVTGLEFIYAQSPDSMKGLMTGLFYSIFGIFSGIGAVLKWVMIDKKKDTLLFFCVISGICLIGLVVYGIVACWYRNRRRPTNDQSEEDMLHRSYATSVYLSSN